MTRFDGIVIARSEADAAIRGIGGPAAGTLATDWAGQAEAEFSKVMSSRMRAFARMAVRRAMAMRATLAGFPASRAGDRLV